MTLRPYAGYRVERDYRSKWANYWGVYNAYPIPKEIRQVIRFDTYSSVSWDMARVLRHEAKQAKDWNRADRLRQDLLLSKGALILDVGNDFDVDAIRWHWYPTVVEGVALFGQLLVLLSECELSRVHQYYEDEFTTVQCVAQSLTF